MIDILLSFLILNPSMAIPSLSKNLPLELQCDIGQYPKPYFSLSVDNSKAMITRGNYQRHINLALQRDNVEQLKLVLKTISSLNDIQEYLDKLTLECVKYGAFDCLKYLTEQGYYKHQNATLIATENDHLACLQYLTEQGYHKHPNATLIATENDHLACLQYLTEQDYHKDENATLIAAENGYLACLQYLTEQGYEKHKNATWVAAENGHLACLQYLTEQGYDKYEFATYYAALNGHLACLQYLTEHGYPK